MLVATTVILEGMRKNRKWKNNIYKWRYVNYSLYQIVFVCFFFCQIIVDVKWELQDQDTNMVYCFELPVQIV